MNGYLTSALTAMLGWVRAVASSIWDMVSGESAGGFLRYVSEHWKGIVLVLCIVGVAADFVVYLFRWQPWKVWSSFFRRIREGRKQTDAPADPGEGQPKALPAETETAPKALPAPREHSRRRRRAYFPENEPVEEAQTETGNPPAAPGNPPEPALLSGVEEPAEPTLQTPAPRRRRRRHIPDE